MNTQDPHPHRLILRGLAPLLACLKHHPKALREVVATAAFAPDFVRLRTMARYEQHQQSEQGEEKGHREAGVDSLDRRGMRRY